MKTGPILALAIVFTGLVGNEAFAGGGSSTLAAGETRVIRASVVYRDIKVCNDVGSQGDLLAAVGSSGTVLLAPGMCEWDTGDSITLRNASTVPIATTYRVSTCSEPIGH